MYGVYREVLGPRIQYLRETRYPKWVRAVKGNKDDTKDSKWIGDLFRIDLVAAVNAGILRQSEDFGSAFHIGPDGLPCPMLIRAACAFKNPLLAGLCLDSLEYLLR